MIAVFLVAGLLGLMVGWPAVAGASITVALVLMLLDAADGVRTSRPRHLR